MDDGTNYNNPNKNNNKNNYQQLRNHLQKVIYKAAKYTNVHYKNAIDHYNDPNYDNKVEYLSQKIMRIAEKKLSRSEFLKIIAHVQSLEGKAKETFLKQLERQFNFRK